MNALQNQREKGAWLSSLPGVVTLAVICALFWGSAYPAVKAGYRLVGIEGGSAADKMYFAGLRFMLAGLTVWLCACALHKRLMLPKVKNLPRLMLLALTQTGLQYAFYYIGLANTTGAMGAIVSGSATLLSVLFSALAFQDDRLSARKVAGCLLGLAGVIVGSLNEGLNGISMTLTGEGFLLLAAVFFAIGTVLCRRLAQEEDAGVVAGFHLFTGGLMLFALSTLLGGHIHLETTAAWCILGYLVLLSTVAYGLWTLLLSKNPVTRVMVFYSLIPIFGVTLSGIFLHERIFTIPNMLALLLVCGGIVVVNTGRGRAKHDDTLETKEK